MDLENAPPSKLLALRDGARQANDVEVLAAVEAEVTRRIRLGLENEAKRKAS